MIKFENTEVFNFEGALRGMRNPLNSWDKSDSGLGCRERRTWVTIEKSNKLCKNCAATYDSHAFCNGYKEFIFGDNDLALAQRLIKAGSDHRKFLRQIFVSVDITAPLYWWKEFDTYKVGTVANSCSTMHTIHKKEFTLDDFSFDRLYSPYDAEDLGSEELITHILRTLNRYRERYLETKSKDDWYQLIQLLPTSYNQRRTVTLSYENLYAIRHSDRQYHRLDEWRVGVMNWIDSLPYAEELIKI